MRKLRYELPVTIAASRHGGELRVVEAVAPEYGEHRFARITGGTLGYGVRRQIFALRRPQLDAEPLAQPLRIAGMVGVVMRQDDALDRLKARQQLFPQLAGLRVANAGNDDSPTCIMPQDTQIDVIEI